MGENSRRPSAKIYQFPVKRAATSGGANQDIRLAADARLRTLPAVEFGSGWYHDAAIQAETLRKS
jgi:hypothetical protein